MNARAALHDPVMRGAMSATHVGGVPTTNGELE